MYIVSHVVSSIHCNSCNLSNNIHTHRNILSCNELQINCIWSLQLKNLVARPITNHPISHSVIVGLKTQNCKKNVDPFTV
jgi:hypothetical protein